MSNIPLETPVPIPTPTVTFYQQLAEEVMKKFDGIATTLPQEDPGRATTDFVRRRQNVSNRALAMVVATVEQNPELQELGFFDVKTARDTLQMIEALSQVSDKGAAFFARLKFMLMIRKADLVVQARRMYYHAKGLARDPRHVGLASFVAAMKGELGGAGPRTAAAQRRASARAAAGVPQPPDTTAKPQGEKS